MQIVKKVLLLLSEKSGYKTNACLSYFAALLKKSISHDVFLKITAASFSSSRGNIDVLRAMAAGADDGILFRFSGIAENPGKNALFLAEKAFFAKKCGHFDFFIADDSSFNEILAGFLMADYLRVENSPEKHKKIEFGTDFFKKNEKPVMFALYGNDFYVPEPGISSIRDASLKPFYQWKFSDLGLTADEFAAAVLPEFEKKAAEAVRGEKDSISGEKNPEEGEICEKKASSAGIKGNFAAKYEKGSLFSSKMPPEKATPKEAAAKIFDVLNAEGLIPSLGKLPCAGGSSGSPLLIGGGRGLSAGGFALLRENARLLGAGAAATRPAVQAGLMPRQCLAGTAGRRMNARAYLAFGISGAPLHLSGINAAAIIAINTDSAAPIFAYSSRGFVCDANETLRCLKDLLFLNS